MSGNRRALRDVLIETAASLEKAGIEAPRMEARRLVCWAIGCEASGLLSLDTLPGEAAPRLEAGLAQRCTRRPLALIEGETGFWTLTLSVSSDTLIPRGDSEALIEALLNLRPDKTRIRSILDLGTGTGCLLLAALSEYAQAYGVGVDLSPDAAALAHANAKRNALASRAGFLAGNWFSALSGQYDVIISNPPYIRSGDLAGLMPEVRDHEPARALIAGEDGLDAYRLIIAQAVAHLAPKGVLIFEIGQGQEADVIALAGSAGFVLVEAKADLGGIIRALCFERSFVPSQSDA
ncbi:peptide chain release factor N(5)-glutamine methyltransferase [Asaia siamensis]|uniref:Release factor glutamine methyltransferase n=1 Tax=Asaia siamensis TaxID=110479 RepID=A0ABQ1MA79_9PROT|nr:peptide chain release factor N(5)-glutamine methyltransferase [Asaia siamensis]GBR07725.1 modification methylase HemK [Asaia siamensis NRIC 0323]GGC36288.1 release factor glutamine methyltransferase [Asaia siamensis]